MCDLGLDVVAQRPVERRREGMVEHVPVGVPTRVNDDCHHGEVAHAAREFGERILLLFAALLHFERAKVSARHVSLHVWVSRAVREPLVDVDDVRGDSIEGTIRVRRLQISNACSAVWALQTANELHSCSSAARFTSSSGARANHLSRPAVVFALAPPPRAMVLVGSAVGWGRRIEPNLQLNFLGHSWQGRTAARG